MSYEVIRKALQIKKSTGVWIAAEYLANRGVGVEEAVKILAPSKPSVPLLPSVKHEEA